MKEITGIQAVVPRFMVRSLTNDGDRAKHYVTVLKSDQCRPSLIIRKLVLSEDRSFFYTGFKCLKKFKSFYLFEQHFSIKVDTLNKVLKGINYYAEESTSPSRELVDFASYLSGHNEDTIRQMYGDWMRGRK